MENPATWTEAERIVSRVIQEHAENASLPVEQRRIGWSLPRQITHALEEAGLLGSGDRVLAWCDRQDAISKGESPTTAAVRAAVRG